MSTKPPAGKGPKDGQNREDRLKAALKANLARRKQQARAKAGAHKAGTNEEQG